MSLITSGSATGNSETLPVVTLSVSTGNFIVAWVTVDSSSQPTVSDTLDNTYTFIVQRRVGTTGSYYLNVYYCEASVGTNASDAITTSSDFGGDAALLVGVYSNDVNGVDTYNTSETTSGTTVSTGSITTTSANDLVVFGYTSGAGTLTNETISASGSTVDVKNTSGVPYGFAGSWLPGEIITDGVYTMGTSASSSNIAAIVVAFTVASSGGGTSLQWTYPGLYPTH